MSVPRLIRFSGVLKDAAGKPSHGPQDVTFSLYAVEAGGEPLWFETQTLEADAQGRYTVLLGATQGLPVDLFASGEARWLGVSAGKLPEQARMLLVAVPYAFKAADADTLGGKPATAFVASDQLKEQVRAEVKTQVAQPKGAELGTRTLIGTAPSPQSLGEGQSSFVCNLAADCVAVTQIGTGVGLHITTPTGTSVLGELSGTSGAAVFGRATAATGVASAVQGDSASTGGVGVLGRAAASTGGAKGVFGRTFSTSGIGVHGDATATTGATRGVWGTTVSTGGVGVWG
ncbi:MAG: tail fiber domain-containing protein, partial [Terriglobales bacterium]